LSRGGGARSRGNQIGRMFGADGEAKKCNAWRNGKGEKKGGKEERGWIKLHHVRRWAQSRKEKVVGGRESNVMVLKERPSLKRELIGHKRTEKDKLAEG